MAEVFYGLLWVSLGSLLGGPSRYFLSGLVARRFGETFPWGTVVVNASGAFTIGAIEAAAVAHFSFDVASLWQFAVVGFLGSYTTVSSFSLQTLNLLRDGETSLAIMNVLLSLVLCLTGAAAGYSAASALLTLWAS
jgi:CrcB protein